MVTTDGTYQQLLPWGGVVILGCNNRFRVITDEVELELESALFDTFQATYVKIWTTLNKATRQYIHNTGTSKHGAYCTY